MKARMLLYVTVLLPSTPPTPTKRFLLKFAIPMTSCGTTYELKVIILELKVNILGMGNDKMMNSLSFVPSDYPNLNITYKHMHTFSTYLTN